ncbi:ran-binding protein 3-like isoform X3 [Alosa sapidissima]|uniref:ran-binding protein 3-like isoform X3 n=1 Tax=Alosa sapidissima TaxID=34773 RepID=UPI001C093FC6|nr:ran-binding protein 3-like isoform X3 [Alosa sapidissima]
MTMFSSLPSSGHYPVSSGLRFSGTAHSKASHGDSESLSLSRSAPGFVKDDSTYNNNKEKPVLSPPVFVFQRFASMKRRAEDDLNGPTISKRVRSFTYPGQSRRVSRSNVFMPSSLCNANKVSSDMASVGAPCIRVKRTLLRPAVLLAPKPRRDRQHLQGSLNSADDLDTVSIDQQTSSSAFDQLSSCPTDSSHVKLERPNQSSIQFVFGENMSERVLNPLKSPYSEEVSDSDSSSSDSESSSPDTSHNSTVKRSLWESAAATTASCRRHCLLKQVQVITGEERESNVVQLSCKLFVLERGTQSWSERGRGILRLNDLATGNRGELQSRIVMRHQGSLKLILNTKLWPHTRLKRPARRNLQVTATDLESHAIRVFLIQAGARDISRLHAAIHHRLVGMHCRVGLRNRNGSSGDEDENGDCRKDTQEAWSP